MKLDLALASKPIHFQLHHLLQFTPDAFYTYAYARQNSQVEKVQQNIQSSIEKS